LAGARKTALLAIGSDLRGDDIAGILVARGLEKAIKKSKRPARLKLFIGSTAPENLTGEIIRYRPSHIIIVDTVEMKKRPGTVVLLSPDSIGGGATFSTHIMPARVLVDYLLESLNNCAIMMIGIQPKSIRFGEGPSKEVKKTAALISRSIAAIVKKA